MLVIAAASVIALAVTMKPTAAPRAAMIVERPTTFVIERARGAAPLAPASDAIDRPAVRSTASSPTTTSPINRAAPHASAYAAARRRDFAPAFAMLASAATRPAASAASAASTSPLGDDAGFTTELGPCDDGSLRTCSYVMPLCPADTIVAVQAGCWTCAEEQTCAPLGVPRTCNDGTKLSCKRERPTCEGYRVPAVRNGCWSCEDPFTCQPRAKPTKRPAGEHSGSGGGASGSNMKGSGSSSGSATTCGNGFCEVDESHASCESDCCEMTGSAACVAVCGNGFCEDGESATCATDCE